MIVFHEVSIGTGGILPCVRCVGARRTLPVARPSSEVVADLRAIAEIGASDVDANVAFGGFEPFAHPELPLLIQSAQSTGFGRIRLVTDAGALAAGSNAAGALHAGVRHIEVVLLGGDAASHDALAGRAGLFDAVVSGLRAFAHAADKMGEPVALTGVIPVCKHNAEALPDIVGALGKVGALSARIVPEPGYAIPLDAIRVARQLGVVNRVWVHGAGDLAPWQWAEVAQ